MLVHYSDDELKEYVYNHTVYECNLLLKLYGEYVAYYEFLLSMSYNNVDDVLEDYDYCMHATDYLYSILDENDCVKSFDYGRYCLI